MARAAVDIITREAEATEKRVAKLQRELLESRATLAAEQDPQRSLELLKQHEALQDALLAQLLHAHGHHHGCQHGNSGDSTKDKGGHEHRGRRLWWKARALASWANATVAEAADGITKN